MDEWNARANLAPERDNRITPNPLEGLKDDIPINPLIQFLLKTHV
jgi:hypothetical protein